MEPVVERKCSGGLSPARGREAPLNAAGRITVAPVAIKIRVLSSSGFARKVRLCIAISVFSVSLWFVFAKHFSTTENTENTEKDFSGKALLSDGSVLCAFKRALEIRGLQTRGPVFDRREIGL
jgi:hypothetical protein